MSAEGLQEVSALQLHRCNQAGRALLISNRAHQTAVSAQDLGVVGKVDAVQVMEEAAHMNATISVLIMVACVLREPGCVCSARFQGQAEAENKSRMRTRGMPSHLRVRRHQQHQLLVGACSPQSGR